MSNNVRILFDNVPTYLPTYEPAATEANIYDKKRLSKKKFVHK